MRHINDTVSYKKKTKIRSDLICEVWFGPAVFPVHPGDKSRLKVLVVNQVGAEGSGQDAAQSRDPPAAQDPPRVHARSLPFTCEELLLILVSCTAQSHINSPVCTSK